MHAILSEKLNYDICIIKAENNLYDQGYNVVNGETLIGTFGKLSKSFFSLLKIDEYDRKKFI